MNETRRRLHSLVRPFAPEEEDGGAKLRLALEMLSFGIEMKRLSLGRAFSQEDSEAIAARLAEWVQNQPVGPGFRDASHRVRTRS